MATQDNNPGLLSKMVRFVRNPTKDWGELSSPDSVPASDFGKDALKLVIEGKRRDDGIRRREFQHLRKMRQASPAVKAALSHEASAFRSSLGDIESDTAGRSSTLKKIDEIEAQMSRQWWKGGPPNTAAPKGQLTTQTSSQEDPGVFAATIPSQLEISAGQATNLLTTGSQEFQATVPGLGQLHAAGDYTVSAHSAFSPSKMVSLDLGQNLSDPEMEEAAIRYANGDDAGAEVALQAALQIADATPEKSIRWASALLDLYRCTGRQGNFERFAIDYAEGYSRSPPAWPSQQTLYETGPVAEPANAAAAAISPEQAWICPAVIGDAVVEQMRQLVCLPSVTYALNWAAAREISASAAAQLAGLFAQWCESNLTLRLDGEDALDRLTRTLAPSGDKTVAHQLWQLRFDALRLLDFQDDYELAALEFCVTFELSPPTWRDPVCKRVQSLSFRGMPPDTVDPTWQDSTERINLADAAPLPAVQLTMSGEVLGDVSNLISQWQAMTKTDNTLVISCTRLKRVDFSAAGGLLNWVANLTVQGSRVEFHEVPRLVAAFFNLIGINEHAKVMSRAN
jgi:ABC-type transporter Mla MlaB component